MTHSLARVLTLLGAVALMLFAAHAALAQGDKPTSPDSPSATITLPASGSTNTSGNAFSITNSGLGRAGYFAVTNTKNITSALEARTYSTSSNAIAISAGVMNSKPGAGSAAIVATNYGSGSAGYAIKATHRGSGVAIYGEALASNGKAVFGSSRSTSGSGSGVYGESHSPGGYGIYGINRASAGVGVYGSGVSYGLYGEGGYAGVDGSGGAYGVYGSGDTGVKGSGVTYGVYGSGDTAVEGSGVTYGVRGSGDTGMYGSGDIAVQAEGTSYGVYASGSIGVNALSSNVGVWSKITGTASSTYAGYFEGRVWIKGAIYGSSILGTRIDDPRDSSKLIQQAAVVSPQQSGQVNGNVVLDEKGSAVVSLPAWFGGLYGDLRYQLTPIGGWSGLYIADEAKDGHFSIAGGKPGMKVSWQVSGVRQDKQALDNPLQVELNRSDVEPKAPSTVMPPAPAAPEK